MPRRSRIAVGGILTECNHLGGLPIDLSTYEASELFRGDEVLQRTTSVVGGVLAALRQAHAEPIPLLYASACSQGPITGECYDQLRGELLERLQKALPVEGGPVILVEAADCCGGGAAGDSVATLSALVDSRTDEIAYAPVVDPVAAAACHAAGEGAELTVSLGHKLDPRWGDPRKMTGRVDRLSDGAFTYTGGQWEGRCEQMGPTAVLVIGSVRVIIMSRATYDWSDEQLRAVGLDPQAAKFIVAKNPMNHRLAYGAIAKKMIVLDTPGPTPASLRHVDFKKLQRPFFPADSDVPGLHPTILH